MADSIALAKGKPTTAYLSKEITHAKFTFTKGASDGWYQVFLLQNGELFIESGQGLVIEASASNVLSVKPKY